MHSSLMAFLRGWTDLLVFAKPGGRVFRKNHRKCIVLQSLVRCHLARAQGLEFEFAEAILKQSRQCQFCRLGICSAAVGVQFFSLRSSTIEVCWVTSARKDKSSLTFFISVFHKLVPGTTGEFSFCLLP